MARLDQVTLKQLRALKAIYDHGTVSAAANALCLTGPAVHSQLKSLEDITGSPLFSRDSEGKSQLTGEGATLLRTYGEIQATMSRASHEIEALSKGARGSVTLGVVSTGKYFAPKIVALLQKQAPEISINLSIGNRSKIVEGLMRGEYDLCIMGRPPRMPLAEADPLGPHPHVIIAPPDHHLGLSQQVELKDLAKERFVIRESGSGTRILTERFLNELAEGCQIDTIGMSSNETIKQSVLSGLGIALISGHTVAYELQTGRLIALKVQGIPIIRTWFVVNPKRGLENPAAQEVKHWLIREASSFLPALPFSS